MIDTRSFAEIRAAHPFPWNPGVRAGARPGEISVMDGAGKEVPLFTMLKVITLVTAFVQQPAQPPAQPQPTPGT